MDSFRRNGQGVFQININLTKIRNRQNKNTKRIKLARTRPNKLQTEKLIHIHLYLPLPEENILSNSVSPLTAIVKSCGVGFGFGFMPLLLFGAVERHRKLRTLCKISNVILKKLIEVMHKKGAYTDMHMHLYTYTPSLVKRNAMIEMKKRRNLSLNAWLEIVH